MAPSEALRAELRLNEAALDCGCATGSAFMTCSLVLCAIYLWASNGSPLDASPSDLLTVAAVLFVAAIAGKLVGVIRARQRLMRELAALAPIADHPGGDWSE